MKNILVALFLLGTTAAITAQQVAYEEYDLEHGLHVILHQDNGAPVVVTSVMYHVGSKDENPEKTGFAHFLNTCSLKEQRTFSAETFQDRNGQRRI